MQVIGIIGIIVGTLGVAFGLRCYLELWRWARQCQHARIAIAYKRKVKVQAPLTEWLAWINQADKDKSTTGGRVIYNLGGTSVAVIKKNIPPGRLRRKLQRKQPAAAPANRNGRWEAQDETVAQS